MIEITFISREKVKSITSLNQEVSQIDASNYVIIAPEKLKSFICDHLEEKRLLFDICHAGLAEGGVHGWEVLQQFVFNWNFMIPSASHDSFSWISGQQVLIFSKNLWDSENGFDEQFSLNAALSEFTYRCMRAGALVSYQSQWGLKLIEEDLHHTLPPTSRDLTLFSHRHLGSLTSKLVSWYLLEPVAKTEALNQEVLKSHPVKLKQIAATADPCPPYTAIIPTIHRYDYIGKSIDSLLRLEYPPAEIIVVDQTRIDQRRPEIYQPYIDTGRIRLFYLDTPGQCVSRNLAINEAQTEWLLFFEDDTEAWPGMMAAHWSLLSLTIADVSTGVSLAPWKDETYIPLRNRQWAIADVLATGNAFMRKETALSVGGLNLAFDHGSGADDDFGRRLFLNGKLIVFNHNAIQTHHKAPQGGMRVHGAWWRYSSTLTSAFPPPTQQYMIQTYYPSNFHLIQNLMFYIGVFKKSGFWKGFLGLVLMPLKFHKSMSGYRRIIERLKVV
jgi:glycosyltransferase involved in cell wall biosynthesis